MESLRGQVLIAAPGLLDPNFDRTVVLICDHDEDGALGLVLNRPGEVAVAEAAPDLAELVAEGDVLYVGGPVAPERAVILADFDDPSDAGLIVVGGVGMPAGDADIALLPAAVSRVRVFAGHSGWAPGQLEAELEADGWITTPALPEDVFAEDPERLWSVVLERMGGEYALVARMPPDPSVN